MAVVVKRRADGGKEVLNWRPTENGYWIAERGPRPKVGWPIYRVSELLAADTANTIYIVEGEKDADNLARHGLIATTSLGGAGQAKSMDWSPLAARSVVILSDHDVPGRRHAEDVARLALSAGARSVIVLPLPGEPWDSDLPEKHGRDVSDWIEGGGTVEELINAAAAVEPVGPLDAVRQAWPRLTPWAAWGEAKPVDWTVPDLVPAGAFVLLYGPPGCGKSLVALEWAARAASDGLAVYVVGEGAGGIAGRLEAWRRVHGDDPPAALALWRGAVQIAEPAELDGLVGAIEATAAALSLPPRLVVLDTLACCTIGRDENNASDAGLFAAAVGRLQATGAAVVVIHHPDKAGRGPRGSGAFLGAAAVSIRADANGAVHTLTVEKSKDGGREGWRVLYRREVVELGRDEHGDPVTGAAAMRGATHAAGERGARPERHGALTKNRRRWLEACLALWADDEPATMAAITKRSGLDKPRAVEQARWARAAGYVEGGHGVPYTPGGKWPEGIDAPERNGTKWNETVPGVPADGRNEMERGSYKDPVPFRPEASQDADQDEVLI